MHSTADGTEPPARDPSGPAPWGARAPGPAVRALIAAARATPRLPFVKQLPILLRRIARGLTDGPVDVRHWGLRLRLRLEGNVSEGIFLFRPSRWDREERALLGRWLRPGDTYVDVGANAGGYIWWIQRILGSRWRGLAVEPDPELRARLDFNLATNGLDHVRTAAVAVGPEPGRLTLRVDPGNRGQNELVPEGPVTGGTGVGRGPYGDAVRYIEVRVVPLPELLEEAGLERVDVLKVDVEGLEAAVVRDFVERAPESMLPRLILMEIRDTREHAEALDRLRARGYREDLRTRLNVGMVRPG